jgi:hypothetical protein
MVAGALRLVHMHCRGISKMPLSGFVSIPFVNGLENQDVKGRIILKWLLEKHDGNRLALFDLLFGFSSKDSVSWSSFVAVTILSLLLRRGFVATQHQAPHDGRMGWNAPIGL